MQAKHRLLSISRWLGSIPSLAYALIYLGLIPTFAFWYYCMPGNFHHSTLQKENTMTGEYGTFVGSLWNEIYYEFYDVRNGRGTPNFRTKTIRNGAEVAPTSVDNLEISGQVVSFNLHGYLKHPNYTVRDFVIPMQFDLLNGLIFVRSDKEGEEQYESKKLLFKWTPETIHQIGSSFEQKDIEAAFFPIEGYQGRSLNAPEKLLNDMRSYSSGVEGVGSEVEGNGMRMLYLSAVTITTVGYGDIVPLTTWARFAVSLEAVLGIVLIGLFLNALGYERGLMEELLKKEKIQERRKQTLLKKTQKAQKLAEKQLKSEESLNPK